MKISYNWLSDYVDIDDIAPEELAERLTLATAESEGVEVVRNAAAEARVATILDVTPLPGENGPERKLLTVDVGTTRTTTVTTAPNVRAGGKVAYAPPGANLPGGAVGVTTFGEHTSNGMLCSAAELGLGQSHETVLECPPDAENGTALSTWIPAWDALIDFDNKSLTHRPDLWGHYGFAREAAAILERDLRRLPTADLTAHEGLPGFPARNEAEDDCPCFGCLAVDIAENVPSPLVVQARLHILGQRTFNVLVDATNYVALELGQPTHIYDRRIVTALRVARAGESTTFETLDGQSRQVQPEDLMIFSATEPIGLAGIMGGLHSGVRADTTEVLLESANFRAARVRKTSVRLGLRTDASQRYEKGQPPSNAPAGLGRLMRLLDDAGARPVAVSRPTILGDPALEPRTIAMPQSYISERAGVDIPAERISSILTGLGFGTSVENDRLTVTVPPFRSAQDVSLPADILEEVLRVYGYGSIPSQAPSGSLTSTPIPGGVRAEHKARRLLAQTYGFTEVENHPWFDDNWNKRLGYSPGDTLRLANPVAPERSRLRTAMMPGLLRNVLDNLDYADEFALFEIGRIYQPGHFPENHHSSNPATHAEEVRLAGVSVRPARATSVEDHYRTVKGALEDLGLVLGGGTPRTGAAHEDGGDPWQVPDLWADIRLGDRVIGTIGILMGPVLDAVAPQRQAVWFEVELAPLAGQVYQQFVYEPLPSVPGSRQDFSLLWSESEGYESLAGLLDEFEHPLVQRREFVTLYRGKGLPPGMGSYTFRFWLQAADHTLTSAELDSFRDDFLAFVKDRGVSLR